MFSTFIVSLALGLNLFWGGLFYSEFQNDKSCVPFKPGQEIPDDNRWLSVCISDPVAPENGIITSVSIKYTIDHPNPNQLEIRLSKKGAKADSILWEPGNGKGALFGKANGLQELSGAPAEGDWVLDIRNAQSGGKGYLNEVSLAVDYAPVSPVPEATIEGSGNPVSIRIPDGATPANIPDTDPLKSDPSSMSMQALTSGWQQILNGAFEGIFPSTGWQVLDANPNDGKQY